MSDLFETFENLSRSISLRDAIKKEYIFDERAKAAHQLFYFKDFKLDIVFWKKGAAGLKNILSAHICPRDDMPFYLFLSEAMLTIDPSRYTNYTYFSLATPGQMTACVTELANAVEQALPALISYTANADGRQKLFYPRAEEINDYLNTDLFVCVNGNCAYAAEDVNADAYFPLIELFYVSKYASYAGAPYAAFFRGDNEKALEGISRKRQKSQEFERIAALPENAVFFTSLQKELFCKGRRGGRLSDLPKLLGILLLYTLIALIPAAVFFGAVFLFSSGFFARGTLFSTSYLAFPYLVFPVILSGPLFFLFDQRLAYRLFYPKEDYMYYEQMQGGFGRTALRLFAALVFAALILETVFMGRQTVRFEENRFSVAYGHFNFTQKNYLYEQIGRAEWKQRGDERILVFHLSDGSAVAFDDVFYLDERIANEKILPILARKGIKIAGGQAAESEETGK